MLHVPAELLSKAAMGGTAAFCVSDRVTQKTLMDVERKRPRQGTVAVKERHQIQRRGRATSKVCGCFNLSLWVSPLAGEDGGWGGVGIRVGVRVWGSVGHRLWLVSSSHCTPPAL